MPLWLLQGRGWPLSPGDKRPVVGGAASPSSTLQAGSAFVCIGWPVCSGVVKQVTFISPALPACLPACLYACLPAAAAGPAVTSQMHSSACSLRLRSGASTTARWCWTCCCRLRLHTSSSSSSSSRQGLLGRSHLQAAGPAAAVLQTGCQPGWHTSLLSSRWRHTT